MAYQPLWKRSRKSPQAGLTILETVIAMMVLMISTGGLLMVGAAAIVSSENGGHLLSRATEYAQDKVEQLMSLNYTNNNADTTVFPTNTAPSATGSGLAVGGSSDPDAPVNKYVDYLDANGEFLGGGSTAPAGWFYQRVWQVEDVVAYRLKRITVTCRVRRAAGASTNRPTATVAFLKAYPF
jgi:hypothetical protein